MATARCEIYRTEGADPTGEHAVPCGAPAEYCKLCELNVCPACHAHLAVSHLRQKKVSRPVSFPPRAVGQR